MYLQTLTLENFRNHGRFELNFEPENNITYIVGENARGKTNILEAVYLLALTKSFRTSKQNHLIQWGQDYGRVKGSLILEGVGGSWQQPSNVLHERQSPLQLEVFMGNPPQPLKVLKRNNIKVSAPNFIGHCQVVFFHPEDLNMLYLGPELRRRYLDILNIQINSDYYRALRNYRRLLTQRNALLRTIREGGMQARNAHSEDLQIWNERLSEEGSLLILERYRTVEFLQEKLQDIYQKISQADEKVSLHYRCGLLALESTDGPSGNFDLPTLKANFRKMLDLNLNRDLQAQVTTSGPHRDDLEFFLNDRPLGEHASRGEYRSLLLSLKLLELIFLENRSGEKPILLLDDVFSELDLGRQKMLLEAIESHQTIITATHYHDVYNFKQGKVLEL